MEKIKIGKIVNAVALRGEVKVYAYSDRKERYEELKEILVENKKELRWYDKSPLGMIIARAVVCV